MDVENDSRARTGADGQVDWERVHDLLVKTSRTFALAIPVLPRPTLQEVTVAYLLFRIADTFEDASREWPEERQLWALDEFARLLRDPSPPAARGLATDCREPAPTAHAGYLELLAEIPLVMDAFAELSVEAKASVRRHTLRTAEGMAGFVRRTGSDGVLRLDSVEDLRDYCYVVAGIVGEMLTDLFLLAGPELAAVADGLRRRAALFGEGLQLVNILKDSAADAGEGRNYVPAGIGRERIFELARADLDAAAEYCLAIQQAGGPVGILRFTALPVALAWATLDRVEESGPGAKLTRTEVYLIQRRMNRAIATDRPVLTPPVNA
ncbi:MAG: squalene/phytoene synthase family protein [Thermoanaerobaculia bacterium]